MPAHRVESAADLALSAAGLAAAGAVVAWRALARPRPEPAAPAQPSSSRQ